MQASIVRCLTSASEPPSRTVDDADRTRPTGPVVAADNDRQPHSNVTAESAKKERSEKRKKKKDKHRRALTTARAVAGPAEQLPMVPDDESLDIEAGRRESVSVRIGCNSESMFTLILHSPHCVITRPFAKFSFR